jgi:hypothetical protein
MSTPGATTSTQAPVLPHVYSVSALPWGFVGVWRGRWRGRKGGREQPGRMARSSRAVASSAAPIHLPPPQIRTRDRPAELGGVVGGRHGDGLVDRRGRDLARVCLAVAGGDDDGDAAGTGAGGGCSGRSSDVGSLKGAVDAKALGPAASRPLPAARRGPRAHLLLTSERTAWSIASDHSPTGTPSDSVTTAGLRALEATQSSAGGGVGREGMWRGQWLGLREPGAR